MALNTYQRYIGNGGIEHLHKSRHHHCECNEPRVKDSRTGLKTTQRAILAQIRRSEPTSVGSLAEALVMDAGALAHTLKPLGRDGLVSIDVDHEDRRNRVVTLTPAGRTRLAESDMLWENAQRGFEAAFGRSKSEALREAMRFLVSGEFIRAFEKATSTSKAEMS